MMAPDSSVPSRAPLRGETLHSLRSALVAYARDGEADTGLRDVLRELAAEARERAVPPEEVLVQLKQVWSTIQPVESRTTPAEGSHALQRVVTMCIKEYFR